MNLDDALNTFVHESQEMLADMERLLLELEAEQGTQDAEQLNALFRSAHTIKGSAGLFGLDDVVAFTHVVENVLDRVRDGDVPLEPALSALLLKSRDHIATLIEAAGDALPPGVAAAGESLLHELAQYQKSEPADAAGVRSSSESRAAQDGSGGAKSGAWHISLRFGPDVLRNGMDPLGFIRYLGTLGRVTSISTLADALPEREAFDPESCHLGFEIDLDADTDEAAIEDVFEFVRDDCELRILSPASQSSDYVALIRELPEDDLRLGDILMASGALTREQLETGLDRQQSAGAELSAQSPRLGEVLVESGSVQSETIDAALDKQQLIRANRKRGSNYIRIQADKLDSLINLVGELVIASATAELCAQTGGDTPTREAVAAISSLVEDIRDGSLELRMVPIGETFQRFQRVVRDTSKELGKDIALKISGADAELDKTVVEKIADPLTHLVRNAMDHGIESAERRARCGKPAQGSVHLNAYHEAGSIAIEVSDDGGGLNRDRIMAKALERGVIDGADDLSDPEVFQLIFEPGFSTAEQVTNLSGRGVGMDVVKRNIEALRGTVEIESREDVGTTVRVRLPLTLAIIDGFLMNVGTANYVVPLDNVVECIEFREGQGDDVGEHDFVDLRGEVLPLIRLREQFDLRSAPPHRQSILVVAHGGQKTGLVVDELLGEHQTVIKPLGDIFSDVEGLAGSTILGSGKVALILDVPALMQIAIKKGEQAAKQRHSSPRRVTSEVEK